MHQHHLHINQELRTMNMQIILGELNYEGPYRKKN